MEQLHVYHRMLQAQDAESEKKIYDTWVNEIDPLRDWYSFRSYRAQPAATKL